MTIGLKASADGLSGSLQVGGTDVMRFGNDSSGQPFSFRNILINGDFRINQRAYTSAAVLAAGAYGHDRWKAGASGGDYTFTQLASSTTITIAGGKSLIQVVEDKNVVGGSYVLSWTGTAQARVGLNSATPSGAYAASPILITGQTAGTVMSVEFNTGTLGKAQLESGSIATSFEQRPITYEFNECFRYYQISSGNGLIPTNGAQGNTIEEVTGSINEAITATIRFRVSMRASPTITVYDGAGNPGKITTNGVNHNVTPTAVDNASEKGFKVFYSAATVYRISYHWSAVIEL